ncbi:MAG: CHAD domain-containing protein [Spartobacteria bacterium]|nr:CHAD domain-containing protein [Spartobacteria bacterium]
MTMVRRRRPHLVDETADRALRRLLAEQRAIVAAREPAARKGSTAALHDVRVALRRMRSLTTTFARLDPKFLADLDDRLATTCDRMGDARDLDVWIELFRDFAASGGAAVLSERDRRRFLAALRLQRTQLAAAALACGPFRRAKKLLRGFLRGRRPRRATPPPPAAFAARRILKVRALVAKRHGRVGNFSKGPAHDLRRAGRRLRYLSEFFAADLGRESVRAGHWIAKAQAALGKVHDCDNALELSLELPTGRARAAVRKHLRKRRAAQLRKFKAAWRHYAARRLQRNWQAQLEKWAAK